MTYAETERFHEQDEEKHIIRKNKDFLTWLSEEMRKGYVCPLETKDMQDMINNIANWYEIKYPDRELDFNHGIRDLRFTGIKKLSGKMDFKQLLFRLPDKQVGLLNCGYRAHGWYLDSTYVNGTECNEVLKVSIVIDRQIKLYDDVYAKDTIYIGADHQTGIVDDIKYNEDLKEIVGDQESMSLEEIHEIFKNNYSKDFDYSKLTSCINNHKCDIELRKKLLKLAALRMLYSKTTIPEYGYIRAKRFIEEFNRSLGLDLNTEEIDEIMNKDYDTPPVIVEQPRKKGIFSKIFKRSE